MRPRPRPMPDEFEVDRRADRELLARRSSRTSMPPSERSPVCPRTVAAGLAQRHGKVAGQAVVAAPVADLGLAQEGHETRLQLCGEVGGLLAGAVDRVPLSSARAEAALISARAVRDRQRRSGRSPPRCARARRSSRSAPRSRSQPRRTPAGSPRSPLMMRLTAAIDSCASRCNWSILRRISSVAFCVAVESALTSLRHHRKSAAGIARAHRLDRGVEREQVGLLGDRRDQAHHIADLGRGGLQPVDALARRGRRAAGVVGERAGLAHLPADLVGRLREFFRRGRKLDRVLGRLSGQCGELLARPRIAAEHVGRSARAGAHRVGGALHVADHGGEIGLDQVDGLADRRQMRRAADRPRCSGTVGGASVDRQRSAPVRARAGDR